MYTYIYTALYLADTMNNAAPTAQAFLQCYNARSCDSFSISEHNVIKCHVKEALLYIEYQENSSNRKLKTRLLLILFYDGISVGGEFSEVSVIRCCLHITQRYTNTLI